MTLLLLGKGKQSFLTPEVHKIYSNKDYKVLKSSFDAHDYIIINRRTKKVALSPSYTRMDLTNLEFDYKILTKF